MGLPRVGEGVRLHNRMGNSGKRDIREPSPRLFSAENDLLTPKGLLNPNLARDAGECITHGNGLHSGGRGVGSSNEGHEMCIRSVRHVC